MQTMDEHRREVHILDERSHNYKFVLITYPKNPNDNAVYARFRTRNLSQSFYRSWTILTWYHTSFD